MNNLFETDRQKKDAKLNYQLEALTSTHTGHFRISPVMWYAINKIQLAKVYRHEKEGFECTMLFTAYDTCAAHDIAVYICDDYAIHTCPLSEFEEEFSLVK